MFDENKHKVEPQTRFHYSALQYVPYLLKLPIHIAFTQITKDLTCMGENFFLQKTKEGNKAFEALQGLCRNRIIVNSL